MAKAKTLELTILDRDYRVNCPDGAEVELRNAARYLNEKMVEIKNASSTAGKVLGTDRIAVIAALNIAHQLLELQQDHQGRYERLDKIHQLIDDALDKESQLEL
ncbi:cell division protein ZapA [Bacterioplanoides pacificum]|uniref:Cell division protein ZapA n=1 Tax=Bacterioplanoides pacificum TaxID=1171596 RepID=A0ABV7VWH5_9GAMM